MAGLTTTLRPDGSVLYGDHLVLLQALLQMVS